jgi:hypothetical protein
MALPSFADWAVHACVWVPSLPSWTVDAGVWLLKLELWPYTHVWISLVWLIGLYTRTYGCPKKVLSFVRDGVNRHLGPVPGIYNWFSNFLPPSRPVGVMQEAKKKKSGEDEQHSAAASTATKV